MTDPGDGRRPEREAATAEKDLRRKVAFLRRPEAYPDRPARVETVETHMAWVFLTDRHAYKLKKPVRNRVLDYGTPSRRHEMLERELDLNRRLAPDVYLDVMPLTEAGEGELALGGRGSTVDWLLRMRRLPARRTLSVMLAEGRATPEDAARLAATLADFYARAASLRVPAADYLARLRREIDLSLAVLAREEGKAEAAGRVDGRLKAWLDAPGGPVGRRAGEGHLVDGHGDLRPEHIYLLDRPTIIDCLEFSADLRAVDPVDEIAYLAIECEILGGGWFGDRVLDSWQARTGETADAGLVGFYKAYRSFLRARLAAVHAERPGRCTPEHWRSLATRYLRLAEAYAVPL